jgi:hypothetical protein
LSQRVLDEFRMVFTRRFDPRRDCLIHLGSERSGQPRSCSPLHIGPITLALKIADGP